MHIERIEIDHVSKDIYKQLKKNQVVKSNVMDFKKQIWK